MSEQHQRCRFWPHCQVHLGDPRPKRFTWENRREMAELRDDGWPLHSIGSSFDTSSGAVHRIITADT